DPRQAGASGFPYDDALHPEHWITDRAIDFLEERQNSQPFFAIVSYTGPHAPYIPPKRYLDMYPWAAETIPADGFEVNRDLPEVFQRALTRGMGGFRVQLVSAGSPRPCKAVTSPRPASNSLASSHPRGSTRTASPPCSTARQKTLTAACSARSALAGR